MDTKTGRHGHKILSNRCRLSEIFSNCPDRPCSPPRLLDNRHQVSFLEAKRPGCGVCHMPLSSTEAEERVGLYLYSSSGPSWPVLG